jgi:hypothetical protein
MTASSTNASRRWPPIFPRIRNRNEPFMSVSPRPTAATEAGAKEAAEISPVVVNVGLGERAYDIVIGRDVLRTLGERIAALRPGARTAIVTDGSVAAHWLAPAEAALSAAVTHRRRRGRGHQELCGA